MHLAYLDDSDTKKRVLKLQVVSGVIVEDKAFKTIEIAMRIIRDRLIPAERLEEFKEFHASELYGGHGAFADIPQDKRFDAIRDLLYLLDRIDLSVVYGAVDIQKAKKQVYGSADPLDIAFRICMQEVYEWVKERSMRIDIATDEDAAVKAWLEELVILIVDECEAKPRNMLQTSFRSQRHPLPPERNTPHHQRMPHFHDEMFFGDSRYSVGIQLADLCSYFIARHLEGDAEIQPFYDMIEPHIVYGQIYPDEQNFARPKPRLNALMQLLQLQEANEKQGVPGLQEGNDNDASSRSESSEGGGGGGDSGEHGGT